MAWTPCTFGDLHGSLDKRDCAVGDETRASQQTSSGALCGMVVVIMVVVVRLAITAAKGRHSGMTARIEVILLRVLASMASEVASPDF